MAKKKPDPKGPPTDVCGKKFTCPKCGGHVLEEVMTGVIQYSRISIVEQEDDETPSADYLGSNTEDGEVTAIQCQDCGEQVADDYEALAEMAKTPGGSFK